VSNVWRNVMASVRIDCSTGIPASEPADQRAVVLRIGKMSANDIARAKKLRIISRNGTGYDTIDVEACRKRQVVVTNCPGGNAAVG
jgi:D-3-phosphoglycerate dehydrogenase